MNRQLPETPHLQILATEPSRDGEAGSYRVSLDLLPESAILFAADGTVLQANEAARVQFEADSVDEIIGSNIYQFGLVSDELREKAKEQIVAGKTIRFEMEFNTLKGNRRTFEVLDIPLRNPAGVVEIVLGFARDITSQRRTEVARDQLAAIVESSDDAIISISKDLRVLSWNGGAERTLCLSRQETIGNPVDVFLPLEIRQAAHEMMAADMEALSRDPTSVRRLEIEYPRKDGVRINLSIVASGLYDPAGRLIGLTAVFRDITESKRAERERATLAAIVYASEDAIIGFTTDLKIGSWNPAAERIYGYSAEEAIGRGFDLFVPAQELSNVTRSCRRMLSSGKPATFEQRARRKDGSWFTSLFNIFAVRDWTGNIVAGAGIGRDITELKATQEKLRAAQEYTRGLIESSIDAMVVVDRDLRITDINDQFAKLTEVPRKVLIGSRFDSYFSDSARAAAAVGQTLTDGFVANYELVLRSASGREVEVSFNASIFHRDGKVFGIFGVARDVTEERATERGLREEREYSRSLVESSPDALLVCDTELVLTDFNEQATTLTGFPRSELAGVKLPALFAEFDQVSELAARSVTGGVVRDLELTLVTKNAQQVPVSINASLVRDGSGAARGVLVAVRDVSERKRFERERMLLASIVETTGDAIFTESPDFIITSWNAAAERLFGYTADEVIGRNAALLVPLDRRRELNDYLHAIRTGTRCQRVETVRLRKDGSPIDVAITVSAITDSRGRLTAISITAHDISDRLHIESELTSARDAALEAARLKSEFLANMSHEIRTPLNSIIGMTGLLSDSDLSAEQREYVNDVRESGEALLTLINEILDFSKIAAGKMLFENADFELRSAVEGAVEVVIEQARRKGLELTVSIDPETPHMLHGDPARLRQVLLNLLSNAIKFTESGEIGVTASKLSENPREAVLRFEVRDTGIGIPDSKKHLLFQPFTQVDASTSRHFGGTGLGLSIAREIVERMDGTIAVTSTEGVGSTFWFTAKFGKQVNASVPVADMLTSLAGQRAIVVDDNANSRKILGEELKSWGMDAALAESAGEAIDLMRAAAPVNPFQLALIDVMMPEVDGIELARMIAGDPALATTRIVLISSAGSRSEFSARLRGIPVGAWLMKPVPQSSLYNAMLKLLPATRGAAAHEKAGPAAPSHAGTGPESAAARRKLKVLIAEDNPLNQKVARLQLQKLGIDADCVANGREAVTAAARFPYDLIFMDCQMPEMDGYDASREIRRNERGQRRTRIVAMTAHALEGDREKCLEAGMDDYISKPTSLERLEHALSDAANAGVAAAPAASKATAANPPRAESSEPVPEAEPAPKLASRTANLRVVTAENPDGAVFDQHAIDDLRTEGNELLDDLIGLLLDQLPEALRAIGEADAREDTQAIAFEAHRIKGSVSNFGARRMCELCQSLEKSARAGDLAATRSLLEDFKLEADRLRRALEKERSTHPGASAA